MKFWAVVTLLLHIGLVNSVSNVLKHNNDEDINESRRKQLVEQNISIASESLSRTIEEEKPDEELTERRTYDKHDEIKSSRRIENFGSEKYNVIKTAYPEKSEKSIASTVTEGVLLIFPDGNSEYLKQYNPTMNKEELHTNNENDKPITSRNNENNNSEKYSVKKESDSNEQLNIQNSLNDTEKYNFSRDSKSSEYLKFYNNSNSTEGSNTNSESKNLNNQEHETNPVKFDSNSEIESVNHTNTSKVVKEVSKNVRNKTRRVIIRKRITENKMALKENDDKEIITTERTLSRIHQNLHRRRPNETLFTRGKINKNNDHMIEENYKTEDLTADGTNNSLSIVNFNSTILKTQDNVNDNDSAREKNFSYVSNLRLIKRRQTNNKRNNQEKLTSNPVERPHINNEEKENYDVYNFENYESRRIIPKNPISQRTKEKQSDLTDTRTSMNLKDMREILGLPSQRKTPHWAVGIDHTMNKKIRTRAKINVPQRNKTPHLPESYSTHKIMLVEKFLKNVLLKEFEKIKAEISERNQRVSNKILNKRLRNQKDNDNLQSNQEKSNTNAKEITNYANIQSGRPEDFRRHRTNINKNNYNTNHEINNEEAKSNIQKRLNKGGPSGSNRKRSTDTIGKDDSKASDDMFNVTYDGIDLTDSGSEIHEQKIYPAPSAQSSNSENRYKQDPSRPPLIIGVIPRKIGRENLTYDIDENKGKQVRYPASIEKRDNTDYQNKKTEYGTIEIIPDIKIVNRTSDKGRSEKQIKTNKNLNQNTDDKENSDKQTKINENVNQNNVITKKENLRG